MASDLLAVHEHLETIDKAIDRQAETAKTYQVAYARIREKAAAARERAVAANRDAAAAQACSNYHEADDGEHKSDDEDSDSAAEGEAAAANSKIQELQAELQRLEEHSSGRITELDELILLQDQEFQAELANAKARQKSLAGELKAARGPGAHRWEEISAGGVRAARKADVDFLSELLQKREWRAADIATALDRADLLVPLFETSEVWTLRIKWMNGVFRQIEDDLWDANLAASVAVALNVSHRDMDELRNLLGKKYDPDSDRHEAIVIVAHPFAHKHDAVKLIMPIKPRYQWTTKLTDMRSALNTTTSDDGQTASRRLIDEVPKLFLRDLTRMPSGCGTSPENPFELHLSADGFPVTGFSLLHTCASNVSLKPEFQSHSESELTCLLISRRTESNSEFKKVFGDSHIAKDWEQLDTEQCFEVDLPVVRSAGCSGAPTTERVVRHLKLSFAADKKGLEALRGCTPSSPWCMCLREKLHALPWGPEDRQPATFEAFVAALGRLCRGILDHDDMLELGHCIVGAFCRVCDKVPYPSRAVWQKAFDDMQKLANSDVKADQNSYTNLRRAFAQRHTQYEFVSPALRISMSQVIPELLHADSLNIAKLLFKHMVLRHADNWGREMLSRFFTGIRRPIDIRKKQDGRLAKDKWFRASTWDAMVAGDDSLPGGIAAWLPTVCFILIDCHKYARENASRQTDEVKRLIEGDEARQGAGGKQRAQPRQVGPGRGGSGGYQVEPDSDDSEGGSDLEQMNTDADGNDPFDKQLQDDLGLSLASSILLILRGFDSYVEWHRAIRSEPGTDDEAGRQALALRCGVTAVDVAHSLENATSSTHKSWMPHIIVFIIPLFVARLGNLWRYSTGKLESRGGRVKRIARAVVSWQPRGVYRRTINKRANRKRGTTGCDGQGGQQRTTFSQAARGSGVQQLLDRVALQENQVRQGVTRPRRANNFKNLGRVEKRRSVPKHHAVSYEKLHLDFTCENMFKQMYLKNILRIYSNAGDLHQSYATDPTFFGGE